MSRFIYSKLVCHKMKTHSLKWSNSPREKEPNKKQEMVLPSDNNSPNRTDYPRETKPGEKKRKGSAFR